MPPILLSIAGFDPSSGAGVTADLKTAAAHGLFGVACVTALTVQSTQGVNRVQPVSADIVRQTLESLAADVEIAAIRVGMLGSRDVAEAVAGFLRAKSSSVVVIDPVLRSSSGTALLDPPGLDVLRDRLIAMALVVTPNMDEASWLTGKPVVGIPEMEAAAEAIYRLGAKNVVITGGHSPGNVDVLRLESGEIHHLPGPRIDSRATHGTGCAFAAAIACNLARGMDVTIAAKAAKEYVRTAIEAAYPIGKGSGPMNHLFKLDQ
jgi:hydroxymethylpyrimidine/phosphomethylpyrimidine kinase